MRNTILLIFIFISNYLLADTIAVNTLRVLGPIFVSNPINTDYKSNADNQSVDDKLLEQSISIQDWRNGTVSNTCFVGGQNSKALYLAGFTLENTMYAKADIVIKGTKNFKTFIDGIEQTSVSLTPGRHDIVIRIITDSQKLDTLNVSVSSKQSDFISLNPAGKKIYTLLDYMHGTRASRTRLSASGRFLLLNTSTTRSDKRTEYKQEIIDLKTGNIVSVNDFEQWSIHSERYIRKRKGLNLETIYEYVDPLNGATEIFATYYGKNSGYFMRNETELIINKIEEGPKEDSQIGQILEPDDRQPGWRNRSNVQLWDSKSGHIQNLTEGKNNSWATSTDDGNKLLITINKNDITERPFSFNTVLLYDRITNQIDTLVRRDGFISNARFTPDGKYVIFQGSPEAFGGIGKNDSTNKIPSMIQQELFRMDLNTKEVKSITFDFNPNIDQWQFCRADGNIYALCENHDRKDIFRINPLNGKTQQLKLSECYVMSFDIADNKPLLSYTGQSDSNSDRVYTYDLKSGKETLIRDYDKVRMGNVALGKCQDWNFKSQRGDTIYGRFYLPPTFDSSKKYPMLVYYYGGCSPTGRYLDSYYNFHGWAAMGYVVYVIQPSGCTGFGQEFAARHVNTYGDFTADDIIEGTKKFCIEHPYVNDKKIGCLGASYGGFMTQYLTTKTDIFAAAMSHAGISNPASYWGYGYWGYSYSATSAAHSYPWNNKELFTDHAPLFNADKVHTPLLFLHGTDDTNVPINESIQMFTALKILGRETAFVTVDGQNHHILDYDKRIKWVNTFYAWFAKWLQDDSTWWDTLYPEKGLK